MRMLFDIDYYELRKQSLGVIANGKYAGSLLSNDALLVCFGLP